MFKRLIENWVYGGFLVGVLLLTLLPLVATCWPRWLVATFLCLPIYMVHQYEEHDDDRFRQFVNQTVARGRVGLSLMDVFVINVPGVWGVITASIWLARVFDSGFGLIVAYLVLVNAVAHIAGAVIFRRYNPGLATATILFLPIGSYCIQVIQVAGGGSARMHATGICTAILIHVAIVAKVMRAPSKDSIA